jgi:hypothetical protein
VIGPRTVELRMPGAPPAEAEVGEAEASPAKPGSQNPKGEH